MTVSIDRQDHTDTAEILTLSSTVSNPLYRIYRDGVLVRVTRSNVVVVPLPEGGSVTIGVGDDSTGPPSVSEPFIVLEWDAVSGAIVYRVERWDDPVWTMLVYTIELRYVTPQIDMDVSTQFRITPISGGGIEGTPITPTVTISGAPVPPDVTYSFSDSTKAVTIAAA